MMWNWLGSSVSTGCTFNATGLYFLPVKIMSGVLMFSKEIYGYWSKLVLQLIGEIEVEALERNNEEKLEEAELQRET